MGNIKVKDTDTEEETNYLFLLDSFDLRKETTNLDIKGPDTRGAGDTQGESDES